MAGTYVALLRAINVAGTGAMRMADLRAAVERAGGRNVRTYIQSGNVVFEHTGSERTVTAALSRVIDATIVLRTAAELAETRANLPFDDAVHTLVVFLPAPQRITLTALAPERYELVGRDLYLYLPGGVGRSKLAAAANKLGGTGRNWRTIEALCALSSPGESNRPARPRGPTRRA